MTNQIQENRFILMMEGQPEYKNLTAKRAYEMYYEMSMYHPSLAWYIVDGVSGEQVSLIQLEDII